MTQVPARPALWLSRLREGDVFVFGPHVLVVLGRVLAPDIPSAAGRLQRRKTAGRTACRAELRYLPGPAVLKSISPESAATTAAPSASVTTLGCTR